MHNVNIPLSTLVNYNPFNNIVWPGLKRPITKREIAKAIDTGNLVDKVLSNPLTKEYKRRDHIGRVAYFVVNGWNDAIEIDVGIPCLGCNVSWPVCDGNHRVAAAFYKGNETILASISGEVDYMIELGMIPKEQEQNDLDNIDDCIITFEQARDRLEKIE